MKQTPPFFLIKMMSTTDTVNLFINNYLCTVIEGEAEVFADEYSELSHNVKTALKQIEDHQQESWPIYYMLKLYESVNRLEW